LSDVFPCGLDPVGVVFMTENSEEEEDFDFINQLIGQLPVSLLNYLEITCRES
jgi:hypothetical protein